MLEEKLQRAQTTIEVGQTIIEVGHITTIVKGVIKKNYIYLF